MPTANLPACVLLPPRPTTGPLLPGHSEAECHRLDGWQATVPVLGWLFNTAAVADRGLLEELNRGRVEVRALSVLDVLDILGRAGGGGPELRARVSTLIDQLPK